MPAVSKKSVFNCRMCGHCCEGKGGIIVSPADLTRLAAHLQQSPDSVVESFCERIGGKLKIRCGEDGYCVFFRQGSGCGVHEGKPAICRAWPFFRGNIEDPASLAMPAGGKMRSSSFACCPQQGQTCSALFPWTGCG